jgi:hypothetical protein
MRRKVLSATLAFLLAAAFALCACVSLPQTTFPPAADIDSAPVYTAVAEVTAPAITTTAPASAPAGTAPADFTRREALDYFREIAFTGEYGEQTDEIRKWTQPILVSVQGQPTQDDLAALKRAMDGLNEVQGFPGIKLSDGRANMTVWFVPLAKMEGLFTQYVPGNWGYFYTDWDNSGITKATVAIATDVTGQTARNHLIFEEVLQSTGLMQDSDRYPDSIYYGQWSTVQHPTVLDWELLKMLYLPGIRHFMTENDAMDYLAENYQPTNQN